PRLSREHGEDPHVSRAQAPDQGLRRIRAGSSARSAAAAGTGARTMIRRSVNDSSLEAVHERVQELLPWYVNGTLDEREAREVERHLFSCPGCEKEAAQCRALAAAVSAPETEPWSPPDAHLERMLARLRNDEVRAAARPDAGRERSW